MPRSAPCLWFTRLPLTELFEQIRVHHFPWLARGLRVQFAEQERLVEIEPGRPMTLSFHEALNHPQTPAEVFGARGKVALAPLAAAELGNGRALPLPLAAFCPEEGLADAWIDLFLGRCVTRGSGETIPRVERRWSEQWLAPRPLPPGLRLRRREVESFLRALPEPAT